MNDAPEYIPGDNDWSWGAKSSSLNCPVDFGGINPGGKDDVDITGLETDPYIAVYRNGTLVWGFPPDWQIYYGEHFDTIPNPVSDPMPYAQIAVPFGEYTDQLIRDSANLKISHIRVNQAGYRPEDKKYFYYVDSSAPSAFKVFDCETGQIGGTGSFTTRGDTFLVSFILKHLIAL